MPNQPEAPALPPQGDSGEPHAFICYARDDSDVVYSELEWLENQGARVWYDQGIAPGEKWLAVIGDALLAARQLIFFISERSLASDHCNREVTLALDQSIPIIPVYLEDVELTSDLKVGLSRVQALRHGNADFREQLLLAVGQQTPQPRQAAEAGDAIAADRPAIARPATWLAILMLFFVLAASYVLFQEAGTSPDSADLLAEPPESIAVLPFEARSQKAEVGFLAQALGDGVLDELSGIGHMKVAAGTALGTLPDSGASLKSIAQQAGVDYVLEGSVQEMAGELQISARMIRAADGHPVFSRTYQRLTADGFSTQRELAANIAQRCHDAIWEDLRRMHPDRFEDLRGIDRRAVSLYMDSQAMFNSWVLGDGGNLLLAQQLAEQAAEVDPTFVAALIDVAWGYLRRIDPELSLDESSAKAHRAIDRIAELQPQNREIYFIRVQALIQLDLDYAAAEAIYQQAMAVAPRAAWWRTFMANVAFREGRIQDGLELMNQEMANGIENIQSEFLPAYAASLAGAGRLEDSLRIADQALDILHDGEQRALVMHYKAAALMELGHTEEARPLLDEAWQIGRNDIPEIFAETFIRLGEVERGREILASARVTSSNRGAFVLGYQALGEQDRLFELMQEGIEDHDRSLIDLMRLSTWNDETRRDPRFQEMLELLESRETPTSQFFSSETTTHSTKEP